MPPKLGFGDLFNIAASSFVESARDGHDGHSLTAEVLKRSGLKIAQASAEQLAKEETEAENEQRAADQADSIETDGEVSDE